ncbi:phage portal protein, HK97 family/phage portal protein, PBSX family,TIGR01540 [Haladaptatus litoreus]|uniref:Phage portal protein, HK97 family/phage portal protein, PBSX family,TIGR01540 n=1 Tax=Haladaptatus litoreus TaxID=553468 RepID=A0A1N7FIY0_9EURY|nr:phage portal protein [Haladaptatus litoreus]SIS00250.1 phage portal protein, HK97 family/phage portal protein, PBSX family,TIGR01540 [Haladaptatus litoreus]
MSDNDDTAAKVHVSGIGKSNALSKAETSGQLPERRIRSLNLGVQPPYNPDRLAAFLELNETHATAVRKKARYEVGFGFDIVPNDDVDPDDADETEKQVVENFWHGRDSNWQTGPHESAEPTTPEEVKELARQDYHSIGWCTLEILTNAEGVPVGLAHVPANTVRVRKPSEDGDPKDFRGYVQKRNGRKRFFGVAGDRYRGMEATITGGGEDTAPTITYTQTGDEEPLFVDKETGDVVGGSAGNLPNGPANELIFIRNPSPLEQDYGVPDWVSAIRTISADEAAKDYNREFFDNDTIPRFVIKVLGGELTEESKRDLRQMLNGLREESHRTVVLEVEKFQTQLDEDVDIELEPLGQGISEEMDFREFREKNEHEIAKVHEVPPILIGVTETSNRANSQEQVREFATDVIAPEQNKFAGRFYQIIHQQALGVTDWTIEYELRGAEQPKEDAEVARRKIQAVNGAIPINRALEMIGEDPLPDDHEIDGDTLVADIGNSGGGPPGQPPGAPPFGAGNEGNEQNEGNEGGDETEQSRPDHFPPEGNKIGERDWADVEPDLIAKDPLEQMTFSSSNLKEGLFDFETNELYISFRRENGPSSLYAYVNVPTSTWSALANASSHGSYHYANIRLEYPYVEITNFHSRLPSGPMPSGEDMPSDVPL